MRDIPEEDQALEPMHQDNADSDDEAVKVQALTMEDRIQARRQGLSEEHDQEWQDATYAAEDEEEEFKGWDLIEDDKRPPGVVASDPIHEEEQDLDIDDLETVASLEVVEEEEFHDAEEGQVEAIDDDDDDDMAVISKVSSMQADKSDARGTRSPWRLMNMATRWSRAHHRSRRGELIPQLRRREPRLLTHPPSSSRSPNRQRRPCPRG